MPVTLLLALLMTPPARGAEVVLGLDNLQRLQPPAPEPPPRAPGPWVSAREAELDARGDGVRLRVRWQIEAVEPGWVDLPLVDAPVRVDQVSWRGQGVALKSLSDGRRHLVAWIDGPGELVLAGEVEGDLRRGLTLALLPAPVGVVRVRTADPRVEVQAGGQAAVALDGAFWTGANSVQVHSGPERPAGDATALVRAFVGLGVTVGDGDLRARGRIRWSIARGELSEVVFDAPGAGADLEVSGPLVARWTRAGDRISAQLRRPERAGVDVEVRWSSPLPPGDEARVPAPSLGPVGVFRTERALQIARDGDREVVPELNGWTPASTADLPELARDLVLGTPTSAWTGEGAGSLQLLRFTPVSGPPTLVDVAAYHGALSADGRLLLRAHYSVRNDRGAFLRVRPPPGATLVAARVGGQPAAVARDGETLLVPLLKSVETVQGLLDFAVDLVFLADGAPFQRRDQRELTLPVLDAEVAVVRTELFLPVGWRDKLRPGERGRVATFTEGQGLTYGFSSGEAAQVAKADARFQDAVGAWMANDFESARDALAELRSMGASNANIERLQSNVDLVFGQGTAQGGGGGGGDVALKRRVKEQAMARAAKDKAVQSQLLEEADDAYASGDYDRAGEVYQQALDIGETLELLEQEESVEERSRNVDLREKMERSAGELSKKQRREPAMKSRPMASVYDAPTPMAPMAVPPAPKGAPLAEPPPPPPPPPPPEDDAAPGRADSLQITASAHDVVIPAFGRVVRTQHLLLPAGRPLAIALHATQTTRKDR